MKYEIPFRVVVTNPLPRVAMQVQKGRNELLTPSGTTKESLIFELDISVDISGDTPNFLGQFAHGPKDEMFIYVNSGTYAGQETTCWSRRAKLSLMSISKDQISEVLSSAGSRLETSFPGKGKDGGPTCASVKGIEWKVVTG